MSIRVVAGEISATDVTTRAVLPNTTQPKWPPYVLVAETIATPRRRFPAHRHTGVEVLSYIVEGQGTYENATDPPQPVGAGTVHLLTAATTLAHVINPGKGQTIRWFAVVVDLASGQLTQNALQRYDSKELPPAADGTVTRALVGPTTPIRSATGMEAGAISFVGDGTSFRKIGHGTLAVCYVLSGRGRIDSDPIEMGEAALVQDAAGVAIAGGAGFRVVLVKMPRAG